MSSAKWRLFCLGLNILRRMSNCGAHISFSELKGQIQEKPNISKYCGMLQYNINSKLSHKNFPKIFLWKNCVNELLRLSLDLFSTMFRSFYLCEMYVACYQFNAIVRSYIYPACLLTWIIHKQLMKSPSRAASLCWDQYTPVGRAFQVTVLWTTQHDWSLRVTKPEVNKKHTRTRTHTHKHTHIYMTANLLVTLFGKFYVLQLFISS